MIQQKSGNNSNNQLKPPSILFRSRTQSHSLKLNYHSVGYQNKNIKQSDQKIRLKFFHLGQRDKPFFTQNQQAQTQLFSLEIVQKNIKIQGLLKKLHTLFIHYKISQFYSYYFLKRLSKSKQQTIQDAINRQINWLKQKQSHFQIIMSTVKARQGCLKQLNTSLQNLFNNSSQQSVYRVFRQQIQHFRRLTCLVIKQIKNWKDYLQGLSNQQDSQFPAFYYKEQDYFITLLNDNMFIFNSFLSTYVQFSQKNDPFIMRPFIQSSQSKYGKLFAVTNDQKDQYIVLLNYLAQERAKYLKKKVQIKQEKLKQIQKVYQSSKGIQGLNSQIMVTKLAKPSLIKQKIQLKNQLQIDFIDNNKFRNTKKPIDISLTDHQKKMDRMKKIKTILITTGQNVNRNKLAIIQSQNSQKNPALGKTLLDSPLKLRYSQAQYDQDFSKMMRKKQLMILDQAKQLKNTRTNSFRSLKIRDSISTDRKKININNKSVVNQLQAIVNNLQTSSPLKIQNYKIRGKSQSEQQNFILSPKRLKPLPQKKSLLQHNEQVIMQMRDQILKQIQQQNTQKQKIQIIKRIQNQRVQNILQQKIDKQVLKHVKDSQTKRLNGKKQLIYDLGKQSEFGQSKQYQKQLQNSKKLTQLQKQLKKQLQLKWLRQVHEQLKRKTQLSQIQLQKIRQNQKLQKQIQKLQQKQLREKRYTEIQRQQRAKAVKHKLQLEQQRKRQIQQQMQQAIKEQKYKLQRFSLATRIHVEEQLKQNMKQSLLQQLKNQRSEYFEKQKLTQQQLRLKQSQYRQQVRKKLEKQYKIQDIVQRQKQKQQKQRKLKMIGQQFEHFDQKLKKQNLSTSRIQIDNSQVIQTHLKTVNFDQNAKSQLFQTNKNNSNVVFTKQNESKNKKLHQNQKKKMRQEFEIQLFAFMKPQKYTKKDQSSQFLIKDINSEVNNVEFLQKKQKMLQQSLNIIKNQQNNENVQLQKKLLKLSTLQINLIQSREVEDIQSQRFQRFSQVYKQINEQIKNQKNQNNIKLSPSKLYTGFQNVLNQQDQRNRIRLQMAIQEYLIYKKKKQSINKNRTIEEEKQKKIQLKQKAQVKKVLQKFQLMNIVNQKSQKIQKNIDSEQFDNYSQNNNKKIKFYKNESQVSEEKKQDLQKFNLESDQFDEFQVKPKRIQQKNQNNFLNNNKIGGISKLEQMKLKEKKKKKQFNPSKFMTSSEEQSQSQEEIQFKNSKIKKIHSLKISQNNKSPSKIKNKKQIIQEQDSQDQNLNQLKQNQITNIVQIKKQTLVKILKISDQNLNDFMKQHFQHVSKTVKKLNLYKRDQLLRILRQDYKAFYILQYIQQSMSLGLCIFVHNQSKNKLRSFNVIHIGSYDESDTVLILRKCSQFLFKYDPCQQITLSLFYYTDIQQQQKIMKKIQIQFDKYGAIFQKKIFNTQFQRKHVLRRTIGEKIPQQKQKLNLGEIEFQNDLYVSDKFLAVQRQELDKPGLQIGVYGYLSLYITQYIDQQTIKSIINSQNKQIKSSIKHLAKQSLNIHENYNKIGQYKSHTFPSVFQMNLQLHKSGKHLVKCMPQLLQQPIRQVWNNSSILVQLSFPFISLKTKFKYDDDQYICSYFKYKPTQISNESKSQKNKKCLLIKSKIFSSQIIVLPCKNSKYKIFIVSSLQFDDVIKKRKQMNLDIYIKLFFANVDYHQISKYQNIWIPQFKSVDQVYCNEQMKHFNRENTTFKSRFSYYYTNYLQNSLQIKPTHRDLIITPSFIIGIMDAQMQLLSQGSSLFIKKINLNNVCDLKSVDKIIDTD